MPASVPFGTAFRRLFAVRLFGTVSFRYAYPFLPTVADGLDVSVATMGIAVAGAEAAGLASPVLGRWIDAVGRRRAMRDGCLIAAAGALAAGLSTGIVALTVAFVALGIGRYLYDIAFGAWVGDEVPYARRGRITGIAELAWSGAFFLGMPVAGLATGWWSWRIPYLASAVGLVLAVPVVLASLERHAPAAESADGEPGPNAVGAAGSASARARWPRPHALHAAVLGLALAAAFAFASEGPWMETDLGLDESAIAIVVIVFGVGEVIGSVLSALLSDRFGKRRAMLAGIAGLGVSFGLFAASGSNVAVGVTAGVALGLSFELAFVSALPLAVEAAPEERAGSLGLTVAALTGARTVGALVAPGFFAASGMAPLMAMAALPGAIAFAVTARRVQEPAPEVV